MSTLWPTAVDRVILTHTDSTNAEAARRAPFVSRPTWILAHHQSAARGRRGRAWLTGEGNFAASLLCFPTEPVAQIALRSFVAALSVYDTMAHFIGSQGLALKWPNDVLLNGGKMAGILLESGRIKPGRVWLAIGIGINLVSAPELTGEDAKKPVAAAAGTTIAPEAVLERLAFSYHKREAAYLTHGFEAIREDWMARALGIGQEISVRLMHQTLHGVFDSLDTNGKLRLITDDGPKTVSAGDVYFARNVGA